MKNHLKFTIASFALLAYLGLAGPLQAETSVPVVAAQQSDSAKQPTVKLLAWQRVGTPVSLPG